MDSTAIWVCIASSMRLVVARPSHHVGSGQDSSSPTSGDSQTCKEKLTNTLTGCSSKLQRHKKSWNANPPVQRINLTTTKKEHTPQVVRSKKTNVFSVSLKVAKAAEKSNAQGLEKPAKLSSKMRLRNSPPLNAKLKRSEESYEDFFLKNIALFKKHMRTHYGYAGTTDAPSQINQISLHTTIFDDSLPDSIVLPANHTASTDNSPTTCTENTFLEEGTQQENIME
ncbi:hypothetical protein J6590_021077 [Homalodisca vitripennis]|nr:hypothetical protein J6590_021077 [Homalodisca vitripennis]